MLPARRPLRMHNSDNKLKELEYAILSPDNGWVLVSIGQGSASSCPVENKYSTSASLAARNALVAVPRLPSLHKTAEVIGILSGAITFVDAGTKVANLLSSLKNAPKRIAAYHEELQGMVDLVNTIRNDLDRFGNGTGSIPPSLIPQPDLNELERYIQEAKDAATQVEGFLSVATTLPQAGRVERSWKMVRARKLQGQIAELLERMRGLKASIQFWFNRQTYLISAGQVGSNAHIGRSIQALQDRLDSMEGALCAATSRAETSISAAVQRSQNMVVAEVQNKIWMLHQPTGSNNSPMTVNSSQRTITSPAFPAPKCTCKRGPSPFLFLGPLYFRNDTRRVHEARCPLCQTSNRRILFGLRTSLCHLRFVGSFGARGFALAPQVKLPGRVVDITQSNTFAFMKSTMYSVESPIFCHNPVQVIKDMCHKLTTGLSIRLANFDGFANDQAQNGKTLLVEFTEAIIPWQISRRDLTDAFDAIDSVVSLLIDYGADPNATVSRNGLGGTPMDLVIWTRNMDHGFWGSETNDPPANPQLEIILQKHGCELSDATRPGARSFLAILLCIYDPEFAIDLGFPNYYLPIFHKSLVQLKEITAKGQKWNDYDKRFPSPLECSLLWTDGLKHLLDWGVDCRPALTTALKANLTSAIRLLVAYDCPAFYVAPDVPKLFDHETSLVSPIFCGDATFRITLPHVVRIRGLLSEYGLKVLPESWERQHLQRNISRGVLLDQHALEIWNALEAGNHHPPAFLWPGTFASVYHTLLQGHAIRGGTREGQLIKMAKCLWEAGFRDITVADSGGWTPFDLAFSKAEFNICKFFLSRGVQPPSDSLWVCIRHNSPPIPSAIPPRWMMKLFSPLEHDGCACFCSVSGCTPAIILVRNRERGYLARRQLIDVFTRTISPGSGEECHMAYLRLEVFERLGMGHTCCRNSIYDSVKRKIRERHEAMWEKLSMDEIEEIQAEDHVLRQALEACMQLLENLRHGFNGRFRDFLRAIRAAVDLILPFEDLADGDRVAEVKKEISMSEDVTSNQLFTRVDEITVCAIVGNYQRMAACLGSYIDANIQTGLERALFDYAPEFQRTVRNMESMAEGKYSSMDEAYQGYYAPYPPLRQSWTFEASKKATITDLVHDYVIPLFVACVIRDLTIDRAELIPQEILDLLEREGIIREGKLTAHRLMELEDIFAEGIDMLAL